MIDTALNKHKDGRKYVGYYGKGFDIEGFHFLLRNSLSPNFEVFSVESLWARNTTKKLLSYLCIPLN
jgi:hypothetical protein